jgi:catechol 2,3-dioxygenase
MNAPIVAAGLRLLVHLAHGWWHSLQPSLPKMRWCLSPSPTGRENDMTNIDRARTQAGASAAGIAIPRVALTVNDLDRVRAFYQQVMGLHLLRSDGHSAELGTEAQVLLELRRDASARRSSPREAGLFHLAFLLPARADLARWMQQAISSNTPLVGASDHDVSEAIYLTDPEGNGIEIYADRPASSWRWSTGLVEMGTRRLDIDDLLESTGGQHWAGFPSGSTVGHVHLQVGALPPAETFYAEVLGFDITCRYPGATFYATNGYHHRIATNTWNSRGAAERRGPSTGLAEVRIGIDAAHAGAVRERAGLAQGDATHFALNDPWNTRVVLSMD